MNKPPTEESTEITTPSTILMGPTGTGKTYSIGSLLAAGIETFVAITEPNGLDSLLDSVERRGLPIDKLHWKVIRPRTSTMKTMAKTAQDISRLSYESLLQTRSLDKNLQFIELLNTVADFRCDRTKESYGDVTEWGPDRAFVIDSQTGMDKMAMGLVVGARPAIQQHEWGIAQGQIESLHLALTTDLKCFYIVLAHVERANDPISVQPKIVLSTLGNKLSPKVPPLFSEVVYTYKNGGEFFWSTAHTNVDSKNRALPISEKILPDFKPIVDAYHRRLKLVQPTAGPSTGEQSQPSTAKPVYASNRTK